MIGKLQSFWFYRGFIWANVLRDFQVRYRGALLGIAWSVINPLAMILVYTVIFGQVMKNRLPGVDNPFAYSIHLCAGLLPWGFFAEILNRAQAVFIENGNLLKKASFPRICLPIISLLASGINFVIVFGLFLCFLILTGNFPGIVILSILPVLLIQILLAMGIGIWLGTLNVFFRDIGQVMTVVLQFWFWLTPIVYPISIVPERFRSLLAINPMAPLVAAYQKVFVFHMAPQWNTLLPALAVAVAFLYLGFHVYRKYAGELVDEL